VVTTALVNDILEFIDESNEEKRIWVREWIKRKTVLSASENLTELALEDPEEYRLCLKMTPENFKQLLSLVSPTIQK
jgi:thiamine monophosphate kinase